MREGRREVYDVAPWCDVSAYTHTQTHTHTHTQQAFLQHHAITQPLTKKIKAFTYEGYTVELGPTFRYHDLRDVCYRAFKGLEDAGVCVCVCVCMCLYMDR